MNLFDKWDCSKIEVGDLGLVRYITLKPIIVPRTGGRNTKTQFWKSKTHIIERLMNHLMVPGHKRRKHTLTSGQCGGKAFEAVKIIRKVLVLIEEKTKENPVLVLVKAIENAAPREEITTIEYGGARYPKAVECSPQRRVDLVLRFFVQGAYAKTWNTKTKMVNALANEIIKAYSLDQTGNAISKKLELERQADASR
ncbi:30S ribosomal protein S7 [archaeon]|nr:30S ribosomal protein S7 [archaeon]